MKKHFIGFALFSFIVAAAVCLSIIFSISERADYVSKTVPAVKLAPAVKETAARFGKIDDDSPVVRQAVLNLKTKQINVELLFDRDNRPPGSLPLILKFFRKDGKGTRFIHSVEVTLMPDSFYYRSVETETAQIVGSYDWLDNLARYDNIYVIAENDSRFRRQTATAPVFDNSFARAVTLAW